MQNNQYRAALKAAYRAMRVHGLFSGQFLVAQSCAASLASSVVWPKKRVLRTSNGKLIGHTL